MFAGRFSAAFVEAALWADTPEEYDGPGLATDAKNILVDFAEQFYYNNEIDVESYPQGIEQAGHDLWFTIRGHGVGYWENDDYASQRLNFAAKNLTDKLDDIYVGDDNFLYVA